MTRSGRSGIFAGLLSALVAAAAATAYAHHSFAMFDHARTVTVKGKVTLFQWTNPHGYLEVDAPGPDGVVKHFTMELTSVNMLQRAGWRSNMIKAGDEVTAVISPLLSGQPGGLLLDVVLPNGTKLESPVPAVNTFKRTDKE
jgi:uncharacterized protein DUF6152